MTGLLDFVVEAHGGLKRWDELETVSAHPIQGGVTWEMVGQKGVLDQLAYFVGTAMWTYLTQPFTFTLPGFDTSELEPWQGKRRAVASAACGLAGQSRLPQHRADGLRR